MVNITIFRGVSQHKSGAPRRSRVQASSFAHRDCLEGRGHCRGEDDDDDDQEDDYDDYGGASDMEVRKHCRSYPQFFFKVV